MACQQALQRARTIFDLNGYYVVRNVLSRQEINTAKQSIQRHGLQFQERQGTMLRNSTTAKAKEIAGDGETGRFDMGGILDWGEDSEVFKRFMYHEKLLPYLHLLLGEGYRLDHSPFIIKQVQGSEGFNLHGGPSRDLYYSVVQGEILNTLIGVSFFLTEQKPTDGGFCVVKGSHKMNFPMGPDMRNAGDAEFFKDHVFPVAANAGDVVLFSEATVHGALAWTNPVQERLIALYRFAPANFAYARGYLDSWKQADQTGQKEEVKVVLQPPFDARFDRKVFKVPGPDGSKDLAVTTRKRSQEKKAFDKLVFGKEYF